MTAQHNDSRDSDGEARTIGGERNVLPQDAHKHDPQNLWLSAATVDEQSGFTVDFSIPARNGVVRFVELIEVERQAGIVFAHRCLDVAADAAFVLSEISLDLAPGVDWQSGTALVGRVGVSVDAPHDSPQPARKATMNFTVQAHDVVLGRGSATVTFLPPALYARIRSRSLDAQQSPTRESDPELEHPHALRVDPNDPLVGDHSLDHVPGMAVAAAVEGAVTAHTEGRGLRMLTLRFQEYIEHHPPAVLSMDPSRDGELRGRVEQGGVAKATFTGELK